MLLLPPKEGEVENTEPKEAREIVDLDCKKKVLGSSWLMGLFKVARGHISKLWGSYSSTTVALCSAPIAPVVNYSSCSIHSEGSYLHRTSQLYCSSTVVLP